MAQQPTHARIGVYRGQADKLDPVIERAKNELVPMMRQQPGFRRYLGLRTGPEGVVSISGWDAREQAEEAGRQLAGWVREAMGPALDSVENYIGDVVYVTEVSAAAPGYGRVAIFNFKPGRTESLRQKVAAEFVPLLQRQPGFVRYVAFQTGADSVISFTAFASRAEGEASAEAIRGWVEKNVAPDIASVERYAGEVIWSARKD
jgi:quinol monooxygenase YgiN